MTKKTGKIDKGWGFEIIWSNNDYYSGKLLVFERAGSKTSMLFHKNHKKSWFVNSGKFRFVYVDVKTGKQHEVILEEGKTVDIAECSPHQLESLEDNSIIFEVGTPDDDEDRFRIVPGDTQILNVEKQSDQTS